VKITIIGGGPAGLYFARLMKRRDPQHDILVVEQNSQDATYGFGVTLGGPARARMKAADPEVHDRLAATMVFNNKQNICLDDQSVLLEYASAGGAIERLNLLRILQRCCLDVGVRLKHGDRVTSLDAYADSDLIVGADGVNSVVRSLHAEAFGTHSYYLKNHFAWYGVGRAMKPNALVFRHTDTGVFIAHYYTYMPMMSTFVAECDEVTWHDSGFESATDEQRRARIEEVFAPELAGDPLIDNKSMWRNFNVITNERWTFGNIVLLGDALRSAHFSIGSGTRLAMDDAFALAEAFTAGGDDVPGALRRYVEIRKPIRDQFGTAAERSFNWYEKIRGPMEKPVMDFAYDFLTRTGRVDDVRLKSYAPSFFERYQQYRPRTSA
jgi:2-polyprenyl-6-methoxyphenol hydroxylase-like FAD-dependent oxidoreductase